jgi:hypothetical protein
VFGSNVILNEQGIWIVLVLFYVFDNIKQFQGNKLVFRETWRLDWKVDLPSEALVFLNRHFVLLPVMLPFVLTMEMRWLTENPCNPSHVRRADRLLRVARRRVFPLRCISTIAFLTFFVAGPILTHIRGLTFALLEIAPIYVGMLLTLLLSVFFDRRFWRLRVTEIIYIAIEAAICPAYLANLTHRLSWRCIRLDVDGGAYGLLKSSSKSLNEFRSTVNFALEELEQRFAEDSVEEVRLQEYKKQILG